jgi:hypothetical protein
MIPSDIDPATQKIKPIDFIDAAFKSNPSYIDLQAAERIYTEEETNKEEIKQKEETQKIINQQEAHNASISIRELLRLENYDDAIKEFDNFPKKQLLPEDLKLDINKLKREKEQKEDHLRKENHDKELIGFIKKDVESGNLDSAIAKFEKLYNSAHPELSQEILSKIAQRKKDLIAQREKKRREEQEQQEKEKRKQILIKRLVFLSLFLVISLLTTSYFTRTPSFMWDKDQDGVYNWSDGCPENKGIESTNGCPDGDKDGTPDKEDSCINVKGNITCSGCPDGDEDGVADSIDLCKNEKGDPNTKGCLDTDKDGVIDKMDKCDSVFGSATNEGCPVTQPEPPTEAPQKTEKQLLEAGEIVTTPNTGVFSGKTIANKRIKIANGKYMYDKGGSHGYVQVSSQETYVLLNRHYGLTLQLSTTEAPTPPIGKNPPTSPPITTGPKTNNAFTDADKKRYDELSSRISELGPKEKNELKELKKKKNNQY